MLVALEGARGSVGGRRSCQPTFVIRARQKSHVSVMTCGLAACDLKLVWFPWFGCQASFSSSVRLLDVVSGRDTPSTLYFLFEIILRQQYCSVVPLLFGMKATSKSTFGEFELSVTPISVDGLLFLPFFGSPLLRLVG